MRWALRQWIIKEAEFQTVVAETLKGLGSRQNDSHSFFGPSQEDGRRGQVVCRVCKTKNHPLWCCNDFKKKSPAEHWHVANILPHAIIEVVIVLTAEFVASTVAKRVTIGFCTQIAAEDTKEKRETTVACLMTNNQHCLVRRGSRKQPQSIHRLQQWKHQ